MKVGVVAPSAAVAWTEVQVGVARLKKQGFEVVVHPNVKKRHMFFAGTDEERARSLYDMARDPSIDVVWCARGGYGAARMLAYLKSWSLTEGRPPLGKLLVGLSDITALTEFVKNEWGWYTLHAPMPATGQFWKLKGKEWDVLMDWVAQGKTEIKQPFGVKNLKWIGHKPKQPIAGEVVGGNLTVWATLVGTEFENNAAGKILFFEDIDEAFYRIDRFMHQLASAGGLAGVKAIVIGDHLNCEDGVKSVLKKVPTDKELARILKKPKPSDYKPLRPKIPFESGLKQIYQQYSESYQIPMAFGLPVGHGPGWSLPLGAKYALTPAGEFSFLSWGWTGQR